MKQLIVPVEEFTTPDPVSIEETMALDELLRLMSDEGFRHLPVMRGGELAGIISDRDVRLFAGMPAAERAGLTAADIMTEDLLTIDASTPLDEAALQMSANKVSSLIVREGDEFLGIFTATDALNALVEVLRGVKD
ncbi:CBS domain-containing protein [Thiopseudomonas denitrificans]|uniref:Acetoin utilization protein AcuB n=1 Tax=Thiopseudomonas denitrificans TaxID=1501432 RepID=A0A4R6TZJ6_9GAMM|nr:CBS domain-containing protein [Thiopseudomonas denitrificans]TDQ39428.1 acetoin utilization protein AcuB [Thiopseudomonas denitrificans]